MQLELVTGIAGIVVATAIGNYSLRLPILLGGGLTVALGIALLVTMPERGFLRAPRAERTTWRMMRRQLRGGISVMRRSRILLTILAIAAIAGAATESYDRLSTAHLLTNFAFPAIMGWQPVVWLGIISVTGQALNVCIFEIMRRRVDTNSNRAVARTLTAMTALLVVCYLAFALAGTLWFAAVASWGVLICRNINQPLQTAWVNQHVESRVRATVISMTSQADAIGQIVGGLIVGAVGLLTSVRAALVIGGVILSPALLLYVRTLRLDARTTFAMEEATQ